MNNVFAACVPATLLLFSCPTSSASDLRVPQQFKTIQSAIDAAAPGDFILVSPGRYQERIKLSPEVRVRSAGGEERGELGLKRAERTIIDGGGEEGTGPGVTMAAGATLDGFTVTNVGVYDDAAWEKHHASQGEDQHHEHIGHFGAPAIGVLAVNCRISNNIVHHNGDTGIGIRGDKRGRCSPTVAGNICYRNMGGGIGSMEGSTAIIEDNICFQNFYAGIGHDNASPIVIGNVCYENIRAGIGVSEGASPIVRGNQCYRNRRAGIGVRSGESTRPVVEGNTCNENDMAGIGCEEDAAPIVRNNRCYRNAMAGIGSRHGARPVIVGNECFENKLAGIGTRDRARAIIVDNECRRNQTAGIGVRTEADAVICNNKCIENKLVALGLPVGARAVVAGNEFSRTGGVPPLIAIKGGSTALLWDNSIRGGGVAGVLVEGSATLVDNSFVSKQEGQGAAVWIWAQSTADVRGNLFSGYRNAVNASASQVSISGNEIRDFQRTAIVVKQPSHPAHVFGNKAYSKNEFDETAKVEEPVGIVSDNRLLLTAEK